MHFRYSLKREHRRYTRHELQDDCNKTLHCAVLLNLTHLVVTKHFVLSCHQVTFEVTLFFKINVIEISFINNFLYKLYHNRKRKTEVKKIVHIMCQYTAFILP